MFHILIVTITYLIVFSDGTIRIFVKTASKKHNIAVTYSGQHNKTITDMETKLFNITSSNLSKGVGIELGKEPDDIFLKDPTKYGSLYEKYEWMPVTRKLQVKHVKIVEVISEDVVLKCHEYINNTTETITTKVSMYETVESTVTSFWNNKGLPEDNVNCKIDYNFYEQVISFQNRWRKRNFHSASLPFGITKAGYINIKPGQKAAMKLKGNKIIILMEIQYDAKLIGNVVVNYAHVYGKYHFWAPTVDDIMKAMNITNRIVTTELIEVRSYSDPSVEISNSFTGEPMRLVTSPKPFRVRPRSRNNRT